MTPTEMATYLRALTEEEVKALLVVVGDEADVPPGSLISQTTQFRNRNAFCLFHAPKCRCCRCYGSSGDPNPWVENTPVQ